MARCPDCNKFVSSYIDEDTCNIEDPQINDEELTCDVEVIAQCDECSTELLGTQLTMSADISEQLAEHKDWVEEHVIAPAVQEARDEAKRKFLVSESKVTVVDEGMLNEEEQDALTLKMDEAEDEVRDRYDEAGCELEADQTSFIVEDFKKSGRKCHRVTMEVRVTCKKHPEWEGFTTTLEEDVFASEMDDYC